ncbi:hypothetical protein HerbRD11066_08810 [Herbidospora sp. RD11066]
MDKKFSGGIEPPGAGRPFTATDAAQSFDPKIVIMLPQGLRGHQHFVTRPVVVDHRIQGSYSAPDIDL